MSERFVASPWLFAVAVAALLALPAFLGLALVSYGLALFCLLHGFFGAGGSPVVIYGFILVAFALLVTKLCLVARRGRKLMVRHQRMVMGVFVALVIAPAVGWYLSGIWPTFPKAYWSVAGVYMLYGLWLLVDAWEDHWSL